jgi:SAM-dependent methyltransferase
MEDSRRQVDLPVHVPVEAIALDDASRARMRDFMAADAFSMVMGFALGHAVFTFTRSALFRDLERDGFIRAEESARVHGLSHRHAVGLLRFLVTQDLFTEERGETFWPTQRGRAMFSPPALGWLRMFIGGYGPLMETSLDLLTGKKVHGKDVRRDGYFVGAGSSIVTSAIFDEVPYRLIERYQLRAVADLGCGGGRFLIEWARRHPDNRGVGVDISAEAIQSARDEARRAGVHDRVRFVVADGFDLSALSRECGAVDIFYAFAMEHELLRDGEQAVLGHIDQMSAQFPGKRYLMGEPMLQMIQPDGPLYWAHVLSHQGYPRNVPGWCDLLRRLEKAELERVYLPEHRKMCGYFDIRL